MARISPWRMAVLVAAVAVAAPGVGFAHGDRHDDAAAKAARPAVAPEQKPWGIAGDPAKVTRTIRMDMSDEMKYHPARITVKRGETVRFEIANRGGVMHEVVVGTMAELASHAALMRKHPEMEHDEPYMAHVAPGKSETIVWHFNRAGEFHYACLIPGHFEAGMIGKVVVR